MDSGLVISDSLSIRPRVDEAPVVEGPSSPIERMPTSTILRAAVSHEMVETLRNARHYATPNGVVIVAVPMGGEGKEIAEWCHALVCEAGSPYLSTDLTSVEGDRLVKHLVGEIHIGFFGKRERVAGLIHSAHGGTLCLNGLDRLSPVQADAILHALTENFLSHGDQMEPVKPVQVVAVVDWQWLKTDVGMRWVAYHPVVEVSPLAKRRDDIVPLAHAMLDEYCHQWGLARKRFSREALRYLRKYNWPMNVMELRRTIASAIQLCHETEVGVEHLEWVEHRFAAGALDGVSLEDLVHEKLKHFFSRLKSVEVRELYEAILSKVERPLFSLTLDHVDGNQCRAAEVLGLSRNTLRTKLKKLGLDGGKTRKWTRRWSGRQK